MNVLIVAGRNGPYGTGHYERMKILADLLETSREARACLTTPEEFSEPYARNAPCVIVADARDLDPYSLPEEAPTLFLDNRSANRAKRSKSPRVLFHDTIPHPRADLEETLVNCLFSPELLAIERAAKDASRPETPGAGKPRTGKHGTGKSDAPGVFVYSGSWPEARLLDRGLGELLESNAISSCVRVGDVPPEPGSPAGFAHYARLARDRFYEEMTRAAIFFGYFGISILEAWRLGRRPVLYSPGLPYHDELSRFLNEQANMPFLRPLENREWTDEFVRLSGNPAPLREFPRGDRSGYETLRAKIRFLGELL